MTLTLKDREDRCAENFARHELREEDYWQDGRGGRWLLRHDKGIEGATEILTGIFGSLLVHGDYALARFASYSGKSGAWDRLLWMADCKDVSYYAAQKLTIGMDNLDRPAWDYDPDQARVDVKQAIADDKTMPKAVVDVLTRSLEHASEEEAFRDFLAEHDKGWDLYEHKFGLVPSYRLLNAMAALRRCAALLRARHGNEGPPACRPKVTS